MYFSNDTKLYIVLYHVVSYTLYIYIYRQIKRSPTAFSKSALLVKASSSSHHHAYTTLSSAVVKTRRAIMAAMNCFSVNISSSSECGTCLNCLLKLREGPAEHLCVRECVFSFVYMTERWELMTWWNGPEGSTHKNTQHTHTHTHT